MLPELSNLQVSFPFVPYTGSDSAQALFVNSIKYLRLFVYTEAALTASITSFSSTQMTLKLFAGQDISEYGTQITIDRQGNFTDPTGILHGRNSFVEFSVPELDESCSSCDLRLLPEVVVPIKRGLTITIPPSAPVGEVPQERDPEDFPTGPYRQFSGSLFFGQGCNFQPRIDNGNLILFAGEDAGTGRASAGEVRHELQPGEIQYSDSYYDGVHAINGITNDVQIGVSAGMYIQQLSNNGLLRLTIKRKGLADDTSQ